MNITRVKRIKNRLIEIESRKNKQNRYVPANFLYLIQKEEKVEGKKGGKEKGKKEWFCLMRNRVINWCVSRSHSIKG